MDVQKFSVLKELNAWTYQHLELEQCVDHALSVTPETHSSAMVCKAENIMTLYCGCNYP